MTCSGVFVVLIAVVTLVESSEEIKFPKDQRLDIPFPPKIALPMSPSLPIGHLRPLGKLFAYMYAILFHTPLIVTEYHQPSEGRISEFHKISFVCRLSLYVRSTIGYS